jgi:hypothetical protein
MKETSHRTFIRKNLDWERVRDRIDRHKHIAELFPLHKLTKCSDKPPYYCHYLGWRLGTWQDEEWFGLLDKVLEIAINLPGWDKRSRIPKGCEFGNFWSFLWELQTAMFFADHLGLRTEWLRAGPDIQVSFEAGKFFVECTTYHKSFGLEEFISELFRCISPEIGIEHPPFLQFSLPKNNEVDAFLDELFQPYLNSSFLPGKIHEAQFQSPVMLPVPSTAKNFYVYLENYHATNQDLDLKQKLFGTGDPESYMQTALKEIIHNKESANGLTRNRPNMLMVNFLLGNDWQIATALRPMQKPKLGETLDGILLTACGIDKIPTLQNSFVYLRDNNHPMARFVKS